MTVFSQFDEPLRIQWKKALAKEAFFWPFYTYAWHESWYRHLGAGAKLTILADAPSSMILPLAITGQTAHFTGGEEIADYLDAIGLDALKGHAWNQALSILKTRGAAGLLLRNIPEHSPTLTFFETQKDAIITREDTTPILTLPTRFEDYVGSLERKKRHEMKRKIHRFEEQYPNVSFDVPNPVNMDVLLTLMRHNANKAQFLTRDIETFFSDVPQIAGSILRQHTLTDADKPIATTLAFIVKKSLLLYNSGYDPTYEGSGWYLKTKVIDWAIKNGLTTINFLQGSERYKYDLGATDTLIYRIEKAL